MQCIELFIGEVFDIDELIAGFLLRLDELIEFEMNGMRVTILRVLNQKHHEECKNSRAGINNELPRIGETEYGTAQRPHEDNQYCAGKCPWGADVLTRLLRYPSENFMHSASIPHGVNTPILESTQDSVVFQSGSGIQILLPHGVYPVRYRRNIHSFGYNAMKIRSMGCVDDISHGVNIKSAAIIPRMTIWEAYENYRIMPNLRLHQLRVAAVARTLAEALGADVELVTRAGLLHDMGNIMKSDFSQFPPEFYGDKGRVYWEGVKADCGERFGQDEHTATAAIARDMGVDENIVQLMDSMGFSKAAHIAKNGSVELQILEYADQRVAPNGIVSMDERLREGHARYKERPNAEYGENDAEFHAHCESLKRVEEKLFANLLITPEMLTEESLQGMMDFLRNYTIT